MLYKWSVILSICIMLFFPAEFIFCQEKSHSDDKNGKTDVDAIKKELLLLKENYNKKMTELEGLITEIKTKVDRKQQEDDLQKLLDEANQLSTHEKQEDVSLSKKFHSGARRRQGLNPNISMGGDFFGSITSDRNGFQNKPDNISYGNNGFILREAEVALEAPLDPFTRGKAFFSITEDNITIEEAYMLWLNLPLNMNLKTGIFYPEFGLLNRYHDHALPQFDRPRALINLFSNLGLGGWGVAADFLLPRLLFADASSFDFAVINGGNDFSFTGAGKYNLLLVGHLKNYYDLSRSTFLEWRLSGATGKNDPAEKYNSYVGSFGLELKWVPPSRSKYRTADWKSEVFLSHRETATGSINSLGFYSSLQEKLNARFWLSGRIGYSELPFDNTQSEWDFTTCLDFWQSEFVLLRLQYQYNLRNMENVLNYPGKLPNNHSFIVQVCWAMGPHKHEIY